MTKKEQPEWEAVNDESSSFCMSETERLKVSGGWLYRTRVKNGSGGGVAMVFVPEAPEPTSMGPR